MRKKKLIYFYLWEKVISGRTKLTNNAPYNSYTFKFCAIILCILILSCGVVDHKHFTNCLDGNPTILGQKLRLDGYYDYNLSEASASIFYSDGTYCDNFITFPGRKELEEFFVNSTSRVKYKELPYYWGGYVISNDTIKCQYFVFIDPRLIQPSYTLFEKWFIIQNDTTILHVKSICRYWKGKGVWDKNGICTVNPPKLYHFHRFEGIPDATNTWIRRKQWFWCDE